MLLGVGAETSFPWQMGGAWRTVVIRNVSAKSQRLQVVPAPLTKGLPFAGVLAILVFFTESIAAACLALGLFTRIAALMIFVQMTVIITVFQWQYGYFWTNRGIEYALLWWLLCLAIFFRGGGRYSLDYYLGKEF